MTHSRPSPGSRSTNGRRILALLSVLAAAAVLLVGPSASAHPSSRGNAAHAAQAVAAVRHLPATDPPAARIDAVIAKAKSQTGKGYSYSWGGGGKSGPSYGVCCSPSGVDDRHTYGYDCSGLTQFAFWQGAGVDIGTTSSIQGARGKSVAWANRQPGDLVIWYNSGSSGSANHVAIYLGNNKIVESAAPRNSTSVHITTVYGSHSTVRRIIY